MAIWFYSKTPEYNWLSNFSAHSFTLDGVRWPTVEHYYQAQKYPGQVVVDAIHRSASPAEARNRGQDRSLQPRPDWDDVKTEVMRRAIEAKFTEHSELRERLLSTGDEELVHESGTDMFWGRKKDGSGKNMLGVVTMSVRQFLRVA
jgi:N-glycosidase YbiA